MLCATAPEPSVFASSASRPRSLAIQSLHASQSPDETGEFFRRKRACYSRFGAQAASVQLPSALELRNLFLVIVFNELGEQVGGVGIYRRSVESPLPLESAIGAHYPVACTLRRWEGDGDLAELSGLWIDELWRKSGLSREIMLAAMAATSLIGVARVLGFSHQHVLEFYGTIGLTPYLDLGQFDYPDPRYQSTVVWGDPIDFTTVPEMAMDDLRRYRRDLLGGGRATCTLADPRLDVV